MRIQRASLNPVVFKLYTNIMAPPLSERRKTFILVAHLLKDREMLLGCDTQVDN